MQLQSKGLALLSKMIPFGFHRDRLGSLEPFEGQHALTRHVVPGACGARLGAELVVDQTIGSAGFVNFEHDGFTLLCRLGQCDDGIGGLMRLAAVLIPGSALIIGRAGGGLFIVVVLDPGRRGLRSQNPNP